MKASSLAGAIAATVLALAGQYAFSQCATVPPDEQQSALMSHREMMRLRTPEGRIIARNEQKTLIRKSYPYLAEDLGLTQDEQDKLVDALADDAMNKLDELYRAMYHLPDPQGFAESERRRNENESKLATNLLNLLGPQRYLKFQEYQQSRPARIQVADINSRLGARLALTEKQRKRLIEIIDAEWKRGMQQWQPEFLSAPQRPQEELFESQPNEEEREQRQQEYSRRILAEAARILSPKQLKRFEELEQERLSSQPNVLFRQSGSL